MSLLDAVLDASVFWSFDQSGFLRHAARFDRRVDGLSLDGKKILVTGANSGLGLATSEALAARGAEVWLLCRSEERGRAAVQEIRAKHPSAQLESTISTFQDAPPSRPSPRRRRSPRSTC